jgi:ankyrin repeat protein
LLEVAFTILADVKRAVVDKHKQNGETLLHQAARDGDIAVARFLIANGAEVDATDNTGRTPLHRLVLDKGDDIKFARFLVDSGADVNAKDRTGDTPFDKAKKRSNRNKDMEDYLREQMELQK